MSREIAFIDSNIPDFDCFFSGIRPGIEPISLSPQRAASAQIAEALSGRTGLDAIHIIAHGRPGEVSFGSGPLTLPNLDNHAEELAAIGDALAPDGELALWACEAAKGARGATFIASLERVTGAKVAAATDLIGSAEKGGCWELDARIGGRAQSPLTAEAAAVYPNVLLTVDLDTTTTGTGGTASYTENSPDISLFPNATISPDFLNWIHHMSISTGGVGGPKLTVTNIPQGFTVTGNGTSSINITNSANVDTAIWISMLKSIIYNEAQNDDPSATRTIDVYVEETNPFGFITSAQAHETINITQINDAPLAVIANDSYQVTAQVPFNLIYSVNFGLGISDDNADGANLSVLLTVTAGTLSASPGTTGVQLTGSGSSSLTIIGQEGQIRNFLNGVGFGATLTYTSTNAASGTDTLTMRVDDHGSTGGGNLFAIDSAILNITFQNIPPVLPNLGYSVDENTTLPIMITAFDPDVGQTLSYSIVPVASGGGADAAKFTINATTGALAFVTAPDFEAPTDAGSDNVYEVTVQVSDGQGGIDANLFLVRVTDVLDTNAVTGDNGNNTFVATAAVEAFSGLGGIDTVSYAAASAAVTASLASPGTNTGFAAGDTYSSIENLTGSAFNDKLTGDANANVLDGGAGNDTLKGGAGNDFVFGGAGNDTADYSDKISAVHVTLDGSNDANVFVGGVGEDIIHDVENVTTGSGNDTLDGDALNNTFNGGAGFDTLNGGAGNDTLNGGAGVDTMLGGTGNDTYVVDNVGDVANETGASGTDLVQSSITFSLADAVHAIGNIENLTLTGASAINGTGNALNNVITGNSGANTLDGGAGNDTLDGGGGLDSLIGGLGNDTFVLSNGTDTVSDTGGTDTITSTITRSLASYTAIENLTLLGSSAINSTGDGFNNTITGNSGANTLDGGAGNDTLNGGAGVNSLIGGLGNDTFVLDNATDTVSDTGGTDTITSTITRSLASYATVENLTLLGSSAINGTGNGLNNTITGNSGANILDGGAGNDTLNGGAGLNSLIGGLGNDTFVLDNATDTVNDSGGTDTITSTITRSLASYATVENLTLLGSSAINGTGNGLNNTITGNGGANVLDGGTGTDTLIGGLGKDTLTGGAANDTFVFKTLQDSSVAAPDLIGDFAIGDKINLTAIDADTGLAGDQAFHIGGGGGHAGDLVASYSSATNITTVNLYVNNDATIDSAILMTGNHQNLALGDLFA